MKQGWEIKKLGEVCEVLNGYAFDSNLFTDDNTCVPIIRIRDIKRGYTETFYKGEYAQEYIINKGNYLIGMDGEFNIAEWSGKDSLLNQRVCKLSVVSSELIKRFVLWYMSIALKQIEDETPFVTVKHLSSKKLLNIPIPVPPLPVQEQIVSELDLLSGIIEKKREQLKELDALAQSIFYDMFGDPITNEKGWEVKKLGEVCESVSYGTSNSSTENGEYKYLRMNNITYSGHIDITDIKYIDISDDEYEKYVVRKGDILFNRTNSKDLVGKTALFNFEEEMIIAGYIIRVRVNQDSIIPTFVVKWLNTPPMKSYFKNICKGAVNQSNINSKELKNIPISIPPLPLQHQFATKIEAIEKQKELIKQSISENETLFNARMQEHFG